MCFLNMFYEYPAYWRNAGVNAVDWCAQDHQNLQIIELEMVYWHESWSAWHARQADCKNETVSQNI